ncbi:MAG: flagellar basal-body rod protein FlgG [Myxococcales bacterium]|nr:flagellar basal-body rod protein FlgG [Myxococcales bacterium]
MRALFTAATGMEAQQTRIDAIANNLANVSTSGYKKQVPGFEDLFYETLAAPGAENAAGVALPTGAQVGHGVRLGSVGRVHTQGDRISTGRELDIAIDGDGYFQVELPTGETAYTRDGAFELDRDGNLVTRHGSLLLPNISVPVDASNITVRDDGTFSAVIAGDSSPVDLGQVQISRFANPAGLRAMGSNLFAVTEASGDAEIGQPGSEGYGSLSQGFLESSNVNMAEELVRMILAQRAFEVNSRVIQASDEMLQRASGL